MPNTDEERSAPLDRLREEILRRGPHADLRGGPPVPHVNTPRHEAPSQTVHWSSSACCQPWRTPIGGPDDIHGTIGRILFVLKNVDGST